MNLGMRYALWAQHENDNDGANTTTFALRGDGVLVCLEADGRFFLIVNTGPGLTPDEGRPTEVLYKLEDPVTGEQEEAYIEPVWVAGYMDSFEVEPETETCPLCGTAVCKHSVGGE